MTHTNVMVSVDWKTVCSNTLSWRLGCTFWVNETACNAGILNKHLNFFWGQASLKYFPELFLLSTNHLTKDHNQQFVSPSFITFQRTHSVFGTEPETQNLDGNQSSVGTQPISIHLLWVQGFNCSHPQWDQVKRYVFYFFIYILYIIIIIIIIIILKAKHIWHCSINNCYSVKSHHCICRSFWTTWSSKTQSDQALGPHRILVNRINSLVVLVFSMRFFDSKIQNITSLIHYKTVNLKVDMLSALKI